MKNALSAICQQAKIVDLENNAVHSFAALFEAGQAKPKKPIKFGDFITHSTPRSYLVTWGDEAIARATTRKAPHQFTQDEIEALHVRAVRLKPHNLSKGYAK